MIINYKKLISSIHQEVIKNNDVLNFDFDKEKVRAVDNKEVISISYSVFQKELKKPLYLTVVDLGGHHESYFDGKTIGEIYNKNKESRFVKDIEEDVMDNLQWLVFKFAKALKNGNSFEIIEEQMMKNTSYFFQFPVMRDDYCFVCGRRSDYYLVDGVISHKNIKDTPYWDEVDDIYKKFIVKDFKDVGCKYPNGIDKYEFKYKIKSNQLLVANTLTQMFDDVTYSTTADYIHNECGYHNDINSEAGVMAHQKFWNEKGLIYVQTGNTSPKIMIDTLTGTIAAIDPSAKRKGNNFPIDISNMQKIHTIDTPVWCVNLIDVALVKTYARKKKISLEEAIENLGGKVINVEPGTYKVVCYNAHHYTDKPMFFSIEKVK